MCVAIYIPTNAKKPTLSTFKACWESNPDGAGFSYVNEQNKVEIQKGFMTWKAFKKAWKEVNLDTSKTPVFVHFRIATAGNVDEGNTHPFNLAKTTENLRLLHTTSNYALVHNGMLPIDPTNNIDSDTMELCKRINKIGKPFECLELLQGFTDNRIAIMDANKKVVLLGEWEEVDGVYYSNLHWQYSKYKSWYYPYEHDNLGWEEWTEEETIENNKQYGLF